MKTVEHWISRLDVHGRPIVDRDSGCDGAQQAIMGIRGVSTSQKESENGALGEYRFVKVVRKSIME